MSWEDDAITQHPKKAAPEKSWWTDPQVQANREAFQRQLVDAELERMNGNRTFGGSKMTHDKFQKKK